MFLNILFYGVLLTAVPLGKRLLILTIPPPLRALPAQDKMLPTYTSTYLQLAGIIFLSPGLARALVNIKGRTKKKVQRAQEKKK